MAASGEEEVKPELLAGSKLYNMTKKRKYAGE